MDDKAIYDDNDAAIPREIINVLEGRNQIYLRQKGGWRECFECCTGCEMANRYKVEDATNGKDLLNLRENSNCCMRRCCGSNAPFEMEFYDTSKNKLGLKFDKPYRCTDARCCWPCGFWYWCGCVQEMDIMAGSKKVGYIKEQYGTWCCTGYWSAYDDEGHERLRVSTNCCEFFQCCCCNDITFEIKDHNDEEIGTLAKKWVCTCCAVSQQLDHFQVNFHDKASTENKLYGIALAILLKYVYFEEAQDLDEPHDGH